MKRDGSFERCPVCSAALPSPVDSYGSIRCPRCSGELWHLAFSSGPAFFVHRPNETIHDLMAEILGLPADQVELSLRDADAFDVLELLTEVEDACLIKVER